MKQFLENHTENVVEKLVPDPFLKIEIEHISESIVQSFIYFAFIVCPIWLSKYIGTKLQTTCFYLILSFFVK